MYYVEVYNRLHEECFLSDACFRCAADTNGNSGKKKRGHTYASRDVKVEFLFRDRISKIMIRLFIIKNVLLS